MGVKRGSLMVLIKESDDYKDLYEECKTEMEAMPTPTMAWMTMMKWISWLIDEKGSPRMMWKSAREIKLLFCTMQPKDWVYVGEQQVSW